tara:strand:+ start:66 stop:1109 length:1044 start_codon:yes stop_codon:yes gene_type:complete
MIINKNFFNKKIKLKNKEISIKSSKVYVIAEAGVSHFGSLRLAKKLVDISVNAGADAVKFQAYITEDLVSKNFIKWFKRYKAKEVNLDFLQKIKNYCKRKGVDFLCTPHTSSVIPWIKKLNLSAIKVGSGEIGNFLFLKELISLNKPIILSLGMHNYDDIKELKKFFVKEKFKKLVLLNCTTIYPSKNKDLNILAIRELKNIFGDIIIGYSDHTDDDLACISSVALGARVIEKHISVKFNVKNAQDWKVSFDVIKLRSMIKKIREQEIMLQTKKNLSSKNELKQKLWATKSIYVKNKIKKNSKILLSDLKFLRPGNGIPCSKINLIINKLAKKNLPKNYKIKIQDFR